MSTVSAISAVTTAQVPASHGGVSAPSSLAALQSQVEVLQRKYADICGCQTTPRDEKQKQEALLTQQMSAIQAQIAGLQQQAQVSASNTSNQAGDTPSRPSGAVGLRPLIDDRA